MLDYIIDHQQSTWTSVPSSPGGGESRPESFSPLTIWLVPLTSRPYPEALSSSWTSVILAAHKMAHHLKSSKDFRNCMPRTRGRDQIAIHYITSTYTWSQVDFFSFALLQLSPTRIYWTFLLCLSDPSNSIWIVWLMEDACLFQALRISSPLLMTFSYPAICYFNIILLRIQARPQLQRLGRRCFGILPSFAQETA